MSNYQMFVIKTLKKMNLKGGTVIDGFATSGITNTIASECILHSINTQLIATIESSYFSQLSLIRNSVRYFPVRIYANEELKTSIIISEISIDPSLYFLIGNTMLNWAVDNECDLIISSSNIVNPQQPKEVNSTEYSIADWQYITREKQAKRFENFITKKWHYRWDSSSSLKSELATGH